MIKAVFVFIFFFSFITSAISESNRIHDKCGTFRLDEIKKDGSKIFERDVDERQDDLPFKYGSPSGLFLIHYDISGKDGVDPADENQNNIPDYIDSVAYYFDYSYFKEVDELAYRSPYPDSGQGGSEAIDIYVFDLGNTFGWYGVTIPDVEIKPVGSYSRWTAYIHIDNNYSPGDSTWDEQNENYYASYNETGINALKITAAHELHHGIQFRYAEFWGVGLFAEMTSTYIESIVFPDVKDYYQYINELLRYPQYFSFFSATSSNGYMYCIFGQFIASRYGDIAIRSFWEKLAGGTRVYEAFEELFDEQGSDINTEWEEFAKWLYYTGDRSIEGSYHPKANELNELIFQLDTVFNPPHALFSASTPPYSFYPSRIIFPGKGAFVSSDTLDILITNLNHVRAKGLNTDEDTYVLTCADSESYGLPRVEDSEMYRDYEFDSEYLVAIEFIHRGNKTVSIDYPFPNPYILKDKEKISFPAPERSPIYSKAELSIYAVDMTGKYFGKHQVDVVNTKRVIVLDKLPDEISSGIYFFKVTQDEKTVFGKFAVRAE